MKKELDMNIQTAHFVNLGDFLNEKAAVVFSNGDPDCSWGDNELSMVKANFIYGELESSGELTEEELEEIHNRMMDIGPNMLVNLE